MESNDSLFEKLGGESALNAAVDIFYKKVLADKSINHFFANTDMKAQAHKQKMFLSLAFGSTTSNYTEKI
jgi:hemoglobin